MEQRLSLVTLGVADLDAARRFYEALGWSRSGDGESVVFFQAGGMVVGLWSRAALAEDSGVEDTGGWGGVTLAHDTLLHQWWRLRDWIATAQEDRFLAEDIERDAVRWEKEKEDPSLLWRKRRQFHQRGIELLARPPHHAGSRLANTELRDVGLWCGTGQDLDRVARQHRRDDW